jgi:hypothetical protein
LTSPARLTKIAPTLQTAGTTFPNHREGVYVPANTRLAACSAGVATLAALLCLPACRKPGPAGSSAVQRPAPLDAAIASPGATATSPLCHGRPRCQVADRRPAGNPEAGQVVVVRLAAPPDAGSDEDHCDRREYWLTRPAGDLLLAVDCETQWGAENAGPASLRLAEDRATFHYVEFLANDACELVDATLRLPQGRIETHTRRWGEVVGNRCRPTQRPAPLPPPGTGTLDHPVLVLHRP